VTGSAVMYATAEELRARNAEVDMAIIVLAESLRADQLDATADNEWSPRQVLAHLGEFPRFFAVDLRSWLLDRSVSVGRTHEHPARLNAVSLESAAGRESGALIAEMREAFAELALVLDGLSDADLQAASQNVKYGEEPLRAFLDRYVIGHKVGHLQQLGAARS